MSVRHFTSASSEKITTALGGLNFAFGPGTVAGVVKPTTIANTRFVSASTTIANGWSFGISAAGVLSLACGSSVAVGVTALTAGNWYLAAATKATGTVAPRYHIYDYAAATWVHENSAATEANSSVPITAGKIGCSPASNLFWNGDVAAVGVWNIVLSDTEVQNLLLFLPQVSKALWRLNQDVTTENVNDLSGNGADQNAIVGTSITAVVQPVGMFNLAPPKPFEPWYVAQQAVNRAAAF